MEDRVKIFIDKEKYKSEAQYFPDKCLLKGNAGFDLRAVFPKNKFSVESAERFYEYYAGKSYIAINNKSILNPMVACVIENAEDKSQRFFVLPVNDVFLVSTAIHVEIPEGYVGIVSLRSSSFSPSVRMNLLSPGIIDHNYRGEIKISFSVLPHSLKNTITNEVAVIQNYSRLAQLVVMKNTKEYTFVDSLSELSETDRGEKGFGEFTKI